MSCASAPAATRKYSTISPTMLHFRPAVQLLSSPSRVHCRAMQALPRLQTTELNDPATSYMSSLSPLCSARSIIDNEQDHSLRLLPCNRRATSKLSATVACGDQDEVAPSDGVPLPPAVNPSASVRVGRNGSLSRRIGRKFRTFARPLITMGKAVVPNVFHYGLAMIVDRPSRCHCPAHRDDPDFNILSCTSSTFPRT